MTHVNRVAKCDAQADERAWSATVERSIRPMDGQGKTTTDKPLVSSGICYRGRGFSAPAESRAEARDPTKASPTYEGQFSLTPAVATYGSAKRLMCSFQERSTLSKVGNDWSPGRAQTNRPYPSVRLRCQQFPVVRFLLS
jgi:hypothetical protein